MTSVPTEPDSTTDAAAGLGRGDRPVTEANRFGLDYAAEARRLGAPVVPIIDGHSHINGARASRIYRDVMDAYGIERTFSQTQLAEAGAVRDVLGDRVSFVAVPEYLAKDRRHAFTDGFIENIRIWAQEFGARCCKLWNAPRLRDFAQDMGLEGYWDLEHPARVRQAEEAVSHGMMLMAHIADPDTWFQTKYADVSRYGTKLSHYEGLERMLHRFRVPWLIAHMGGWPEDLAFLSGLMERHEHIIVDTSATKWMVRELSKHPRDELVAFLERFSGRVIYGSDIVTLDAHLESSDPEDKRFGATLASGEAEAFDLYASRYWAYRTMLETDYEGESNIADPDLSMVDPEKHDAMSAPRLVGRALPKEMLRTLYRGAAESTLVKWYDEH